MGKPKSGLTAKQRNFARCVAVGGDDGEGMNLSDAYREAYNAERMSPAAINTESSLLAQDPAITQRIETLRRHKDRTEATSLLADKQRVLNTLRTFLDTAVPSDMAKIRSAELLGKACGLFKDQQLEVTIERSTDEVASELRRRLEDLLGAGRTESGPGPDDEALTTLAGPTNPRLN